MEIIMFFYNFISENTGQIWFVENKLKKCCVYQ